ncbi:Enoyl-CoA hydratase/carnithine racemase [Xaviernesmea oryzae]|uniref:Enoyl-CoA hydratase/carnithine racemase n=1 Tax=Xaviernesmea oryzae TaxID=464029 RepID=A0A1X7DJV8_9HYPH|nr:enoyl-CoA hydratase/isomerase family protein [Xaviernesmea oryzae]SMF16908.1 Enoyl-CoA hydratase/carnithine racemase [Xaviernesmea oryzae]
MSEVLISTKGNVLEITLNRPDKGNALTSEMAESITAALKSLSPETRVVLMKANGPDFCTGRSAAMPAPGSRATALDLRNAISDPVLDFYEVLREIPVPFIAAVNGKAAGVGCAIAALADVAVATDVATFQVPEMNHDIAPTLVLNALADRISRAALARMVFTRDVIPAAEAKVLGLIGITVPAESLDAEVNRVVSQLEKNSVPTVRGIKAFISMSPETSFASRKELAALINCVATAEKFR